jgi:hypothetical protein
MPWRSAPITATDGRAPERCAAGLKPTHVSWMAPPASHVAFVMTSLVQCIGLSCAIFKHLHHVVKVFLGGCLALRAANVGSRIVLANSSVATAALV